jgi:hypothetical protein
LEHSTPSAGENTPPSSSSELVADIEMGETVEVIIDGNRVEAFLSDNVFIFDPTSIHARMAVRAYAYSLSSEDRQGATEILRKVGREG